MHRIRNRILICLVILVGAWAILAYLILPALWRHYEHHPAMEAAPKTALTGEGIPADPLNVALIGTEAEVVRAFLAGGWVPADPITFRTGLHIAESVVRNKPYPTAPVSNLYLWRRKEDLAFERPVGGSPRKRHHARFWRSTELGMDDRPMWIGATTFDRSVGISHRTGQITHHIAPDVDAERDKLMADLQSAGQLVRTFQVTGVGAVMLGRNGGGDWYYTDGELSVGVISAANVRQTAPPSELVNPPRVALKNTMWTWIRRLIRPTQPRLPYND
jgi:hypothetical protein